MLAFVLRVKEGRVATFLKPKIIVSSGVFVVALLSLFYFHWRYFGWVYPYYHGGFMGTPFFTTTEGIVWTYGLWISAILTITFGVALIALLVRELRRRSI